MNKFLMTSLAILISTQAFGAQKRESRAPKSCAKVIKKISGAYRADCQYRRTQFDKHNSSQTTAPLIFSYDNTEATQRNFGEAKAATIFFESQSKLMPILNVMLAASLAEQDLITDFHITCTDQKIETSFRSKLDPFEKTYQRVRFLQDGKISGLNAVSTSALIDDLTCILTPMTAK
jgi:hypothetical protein